MGLSLSTSWNAFRHNQAEGMIREITALGFNEVELSFNLTSEIVDGIFKLVKQNTVKVTSVHNYCPIPAGFIRKDALPDCYSMASLDESKRACAVKYTKISVETASRLNAKAVVLHCGRVEIQDRTRDLMFLYNLRSGSDAAQITDILDTMRKERAETGQRHLSSALKSLEEISRYADKLGVSLGIENRFYFREIPSFEEIGIILGRLKGSNVYYWHDSGHAHLWDILGLLRHQEYLNEYGKYLLGIHLHDILGTQDHLAPLKGCIDFKMFCPYLKEKTIKTIEAHHPAASEEIIKAKEHLEKIYN